MWKKVVLGRMVTRLPELPWASQLFIHFLTKRGEQFIINKKQKVGLARRVTRLAGHPIVKIGLPSLPGQHFSI